MKAPHVGLEMVPVMEWLRLSPRRVMQRLMRLYLALDEAS